MVEEGSEGVRIMTVHRAKGLEFPVVVLADITANATAQNPGRYIDSERGLCAVRLAGWSPWDLLDHEEDELARDRAEGVRVAYVAATRARAEVFSGPDFIHLQKAAREPDSGLFHGLFPCLAAPGLARNCQCGAPIAGRVCPAGRSDTCLFSFPTDPKA